MKKYLSGILLLTTIGLGLLSVRLYSQLQSERNRTSEESRLRADAEARAAQATIELREAKSMGQTVAINLLGVPTPIASTEAPKAQPIVTTSLPSRELGRKMFKLPMQELYRDLIEKLKLSPSEAEELVMLFVERQLSINELSERSGIDPVMRKTMLADLRRDFDDTLLSRFGADKFDQYQHYEQHLQEHAELEQLHTRLAASRKPLLTKGQEEELLSALREEKERIPQPLPSQPYSELEYTQRLIKWHEEYGRRKLERAEKILSTDQFAQYRDFVELQISIRRSSQ